MAHIVMCRVCKQQFDTDKLSADEWIMPKPRRYFHKRCYDDYIQNKDDIHTVGRNPEYWFEALIEYLERDVRMSINYAKITSQWNNFTKPGKEMTPKGIFFTMRYFYGVKHGDIEKAQGGIGIVSSIYNEATEYWANLETKHEGTIAAIIKEVEERKARPIKILKQKNETRTNRAKYSLDDI